MAFFLLLFRASIPSSIRIPTTILQTTIETVLCGSTLSVWMCTCLRSGIERDDERAKRERKRDWRSALEGSESQRSRRQAQRADTAKKLHRTLNLGRQCNRLINLQSTRLILSPFNRRLLDLDASLRRRPLPSRRPPEAAPLCS